jgi:phage shock protein A
VGIFSRLSLLVKVWLNALFEPAGDPRRAFAPAYQSQWELLARVRNALDAIAASRARLESRSADVGANLKLLEDRARQALVAGRDDLARLALRRRQVGTAEIKSLQVHLREVQAEEGRLSVVEQRLVTQIEVFRARLEVIAARYSTAEAQVQINEAIAGVSDELTDLGAALDSAEVKSEDMEARAQALDELIEDGVLGASSAASSTAENLLVDGSDDSFEVEEQLGALRREIELADRG